QITSASETPRQPESVVVIAEGRVDLAAQCDAAHRRRVPPRAAARDAPHAAVSAGGIPLRRTAVVFPVPPVGAPFVDVRGNAVEAEAGRFAERDGPRRGKRSAAAVRNPL